MFMDPHWGVVGFGNGTPGSFQSKKNDWEGNQYRPRNGHEGADLAYLRDVRDDVVAILGNGGLSGGNEQRSKEERECWHRDA